MLLKSYSNKNIGDFESIPGKQLDDSESDFLEILYYAAFMDKHKNANDLSEIKDTRDFKKTMKKWNNLLDKVKELENIEDIAKTLRLNIQIFNPLKKTDHIKEYNFNLKNHNETVQLLQVKKGQYKPMMLTYKGGTGTVVHNDLIYITHLNNF